jgi:hypothetical protein
MALLTVRSESSDSRTEFPTGGPADSRSTPLELRHKGRHPQKGNNMAFLKKKTLTGYARTCG